MLCLGCTRGESGRQSGSEQSPTVRLAVVTDLEGYLEPCGCTSNPLGGIDRLAARVHTLRSKGAPLLFLIAGDVFFDTAEVEPARLDQAHRNAKTMAAALSRMDVTAVLPGRNDRAQPGQLLDPVRDESEFPWLAMNEHTEARVVRAGSLRVALIGVRPGAEPGPVGDAVQSVKAETDLVIVLIDGSRRDAHRIGSIEGVDFVIQGGLEQDAPLPPRRAGAAWVLHAGRHGQGLAVVDVHRSEEDQPFTDSSAWSREERVEQLDRQISDLAAKIEQWESSADVDPADIQPQRARLTQLEKDRETLKAPAAQPDGNALFARWVPLPKKAPRDPAVEGLMREHDKAVNEANRIAFADLEPPPLGADDVAYVGSAACGGCHQEAYAWWRNHAHGVAYLTLQQRNKEYNLDCVGCHVTGYEQPGGSTVTHNLDGALVNVGCESCHGPGAAHAKNPEVAVVRNTPEATCIACHNEQHSDLFDYEEYVKTLVVPGHGLPVKTP